MIPKDAPKVSEDKNIKNVFLQNIVFNTSILKLLENNN